MGYSMRGFRKSIEVNLHAALSRDEDATVEPADFDADGGSFPTMAISAISAKVEVFGRFAGETKSSSVDILNWPRLGIRLRPEPDIILRNVADKQTPRLTGSGATKRLLIIAVAKQGIQI